MRILDTEIITSLIAFVGGTLTILIPSLIQKKRQRVEIDKMLIDNLWREINRLSEQVEILKNREAAAEEREVQLKSTIKKLEEENTRQSLELLSLKKQIDFLTNGRL